MKKFFLTLLAVIVIGGVVVAVTVGSCYNALVQKDEAVKSAWSQVENVYQRRLDLIPNLVETVKGYAAHERETLQSVTEARSKVSQMTVSADLVNHPETLTKFQEAQSSLSFALGRLIAIAERYPELKANQNFLALQSQLEGTENRITVERKRYNETAQDFNAYRRAFPNIFVANLMNFPEKAYFKADQAASKAPQVHF